MVGLEQFAKKTANYLAIGFAGLAIWAGGNYLSNRLTELKESRRIERITLTERTRSLKSLDLALNDFDLKKAQAVIEEIRKQENFTTEEVNQMRSRIESITETRLYKRIQEAEDNEKIPLMQLYLAHYTNEPNTRKVSQDLLFLKATSLSKTLETIPCFEEAYSGLKELNEELKLEGTNIINKSDLNLDSLINFGEKYLAFTQTLGDTKELTIGTLVRIKNNHSGFNSNYFTSRTNIITSSYGRIFDVEGSDQWIVQVPEAGKILWKDDWGSNLKTRYEKLGILAGIYNEKELEIIRDMSASEKNKFREELDKTRDYILK